MVQILKNPEFIAPRPSVDSRINDLSELEREKKAYIAATKAYNAIGYTNYGSGELPLNLPSTLHMRSVLDDESKFSLIGGAFVENNPENLPFTELMDVKKWVYSFLESKRGKTNFMELGRFIYSGAINYVRKETNQGEEFLPEWSTKNPSLAIKTIQKLNLFSGLGKLAISNNTGVIVLNCAKGGFVKPEGSNQSIYLRGAYDMISEVIKLGYMIAGNQFIRVEGMLVPANWKPQAKDSAFSPYVEGHPSIMNNEPNLHLGVLLLHKVTKEVES